MRQIGTRLTDSTFERLQTKANETGTNVSDLTRSIIIKYFEGEAQRQELSAIAEALKVLAGEQQRAFSTLFEQANFQKAFREQVRKALNIQQTAAANQAQGGQK